MDLVTGAMSSLLPKLVELLKDEYKLQNSVKEGVMSLEKEMKSMHAALRKVGEVPRDQLDEQVKLWAGEVRELSLDLEDVVDKFLVRVDDDSEPDANTNKLKLLTKKIADFFPKMKIRHEIAGTLKDINKQVQEVANRRARYTVENIIANPAAVTSIDPRLGALYKEEAELVGIAGKRDQELIKLLSEGDSMSKKKLKIVSVVGFGGLGKTTLVKTVYDKIKGDFDCRAFVPVGRNADAKKVITDILLDLNIYQSQFTMLDERQLIDKLREILKNKRYLIVIDDIWDIKLWNAINWAFSSSSNSSSRLLTTTRIFNIAKVCSSSSYDSVYQMKPLSDYDSQRLFYKRIFSDEGRWPHEYTQVAIAILRKCGGVPLAIITIASLLACDQQVKHIDEWHVLLDNIGRGLTEDHSVEEMLRILSFSYYDMPSHLKTCLLYLSMFPEDYRFGKDQLIWMWIAECFVQCEKAETCPFEIGETYFNELVNRSMILPLYDDEGIIVACNVHDMVLELISSLSREENFVTVLNGTADSMSSQSSIRRLSLQHARKGELQTMPLKSVSMIQVRSIVTSMTAIDIMPSFSSFVVLRVLYLDDCYISDHNHLNLLDLGSLLLLRYLGLARTGISELPEEVGKLLFLQVLDLSGNEGIKELPSSIIKLRRLSCLLVDKTCKRFPDGLGNLTSMEELSEIHCDSLSILNGLGNMGRLRKLRIEFSNMRLELEEAFVVSLGKLSNIQCLEVSCAGDTFELMDILGERWVPSRSLREFTTARNTKFSVLPAWMRRNPWHLTQLSRLEISMEKVQQEDLDILERLPHLRTLIMWSESQRGLLLIGAEGFRCLTTLMLGSDSAGQIMFQPRAMPKTEKVVIFISLQVAKEDAAGNDGRRFDLGMGYLRSLQTVDVKLDPVGVTVGEAKRAMARLDATLRAHPNSPTVNIYFEPDLSQYYGSYDSDDKVCSKDDLLYTSSTSRARCKHRMLPPNSCCIM